MMGRQSGQIAFEVIHIEAMVPRNHLLRKIQRSLQFGFIYEKAQDLYAQTGRPSIDPVLLVKMLLIGYLYGIKSERRLEEEVNLNLAYRWFCNLNVTDRVPDHSTFSQNRKRRFDQSGVFEDVFSGILQQCITLGLVTGECTVGDGSYLPANVSSYSQVKLHETVKLGMQSYLSALDEELEKEPGFRKVEDRTQIIHRTTSQTDPDCGQIHHGKKSGLGYLVETTVDCGHGIITGVDTYSANQKESSVCLRGIEKQIKQGIPLKRIALDRGYDVSAVHRGLELLGIKGFIPPVNFTNSPEKSGFQYVAEDDEFICPEGYRLSYEKLYCVQSTGNYLRYYKSKEEDCEACPRKRTCIKKLKSRRIIGGSFYPASARNRIRAESLEMKFMMKLRQIWAEGTYAVLKREHCLQSIRKRGILRAREECLLSATALNMKRAVMALGV